jgi:hypothetical protein
MNNLSQSTKQQKINSALFSLNDYSNEIFDESVQMQVLQEGEEVPHDAFQVVKTPLYVEMVQLLLLQFAIYLFVSLCYLARRCT